VENLWSHDNLLNNISRYSPIALNSIYKSDFAFYFYAVYVQHRLLFSRRFSLLTLHVSADRPSSGVQAAVIKESAVLFLLNFCLGIFLVNQLFYLGVLELHVCALPVIYDVLCYSFILRYIYIYIYIQLPYI
jgi:hypothetical protein